MSESDPELAPLPPEHLAQVEKILRGYYAREVPQSFPTLPLPGVQPGRKSLFSSSLGRSRLALAASIALLGIGIVVSGQFLRPLEKDKALRESGLPPTAGRPKDPLAPTRVPPARPPADQPLEPMKPVSFNMLPGR